jgi:hypothetical protein
MPAGFDVAREVAAAVGSRERTWHFIRCFAELWVSPLAEGDGWGEADVVLEEQRLGIQFPASLREAYQLFGRREDLTSKQDHLFRSGELRLSEGGEVLIFRRENQACARWGVRLDQPGQPDPPVVWQGRTAGEWTGWAPYFDRFSLACLEIVLSESLFAGPGLDDNRALDAAALASLEQNFPRLAVPDYPMWTRWPAGPQTRWFAGPDVILREDAATWVWVRARTPAALIPVREAMPGDWNHAADCPA